MIVNLTDDFIRILMQGHLLIRAYHPRTGKWKPVYRIDLRGIGSTELAAALHQLESYSEIIRPSEDDGVPQEVLV
jgi:hypothetical protein